MFHLETFIKKNSPKNNLLFVDDFSTDGSYEYLKSHSYEVVRNDFQTFASQRNFSLNYYEKQIRLSGGVMFLDADEWITPELQIFLEDKVRDKDFLGYCSIPPRNLLSNVEIPRSSGFPVHHDRFFKAPIKGQFETIFGGHIEKFVANDESYIRCKTSHYYMHNAYARGGRAWLIKHMNLARLENQDEPTQTVSLKYKFLYALRKANLSPIIRFLYHYIFLCGFTEGKRGFLYALRYMIFELMIIENRLEKEVCDDKN